MSAQAINTTQYVTANAVEVQRVEHQHVVIEQQIGLVERLFNNAVGGLGWGTGITVGALATYRIYSIFSRAITGAEVGATAGVAMGGPPGALAGAFVGGTVGAATGMFA